MKKKTLLSLLLSLVMATSFALCACGQEEADDFEINEDPSAMQATATPQQIEKAKEMNEDTENFYGTWIATSPEAQNLYGSLEFTINEDGTFDADVTHEVFSGTWKKTNSGITYTSELMSGKIWYAENGDLIIEDDQDTRVSLQKK